MKNALMTIVLILASIGLVQAQTTATIFGNVVNTQGQPVPEWPVFQDLFGNLTLTDASGAFLLTATLDSGTVVSISTINCDGVVLTQTMDVSLPGIPVIFTICDSVAPPPHPPTGCFADFGYQQTANLSVNFYGYAWSFDDSLATFTFTWDFGNGTTATGDLASQTYAAPGNYPVTLIATSATCSDTIQYWVDVIDFGPTKTVQVTGSVLDEDTLDPIGGWWVTAYGANPFVTAFGNTEPDGTYTLTVEVPDTATSVLVETYDLCQGIAIQIDAPLISGVAGWTAQADFFICSDSIFPPPAGCHAYISYTQVDSLTFQFAATDWSGNPIVSYSWDFGDGNTSTDPTPTHTYAQEGLYTVALTGVTADSCTLYTCEVVCAFGNGGGVPIDTFFYGCQAYFMAYPIGFVPDFKTFQFESLSMGQVVSYAWDFGDGTTSNEPNPVHTYSTDGTYNVSLTIETLDGCESTIVMAILAGQGPTTQWDCQAMFLPLPIPDSIGLPATYIFIDMSTAPSPILSWTWDFGDGTSSSEQYPFHVYAQPGVYTVTLSITTFDGCVSVMTMTLDTDNPMFSATGAPVAFLGLNASTSSTTDTETIISEVSLYPNPVSDLAVVTFEGKTNINYTYSLLDMTGRTLSSTAARAVVGKNVLQVNTADLTPGMHILRIQTEAGVETIKFVKD